MHAVLTALAGALAHGSADLEAVWVTPQGLTSVPSLAVLWTAIGLGSAALLAVWWRSERAVRRSEARLRAAIR